MSRGSTIKLYFFSCCIFLSTNFWCKFFRHSDNSGLVYTQGQHVVFSYKLSKFSPNPKKYHNLKEVYAFEFSKQVQFRRQKGTWPRAKFPSVNQQPKRNQKTARNQIFKTLNREQKVSEKGKYQGKFISTVFIIQPWGLSAPPRGGEPWGLSAPPRGGALNLKAL